MKMMVHQNTDGCSMSDVAPDHLFVVILQPLRKILLRVSRAPCLVTVSRSWMKDLPPSLRR